MSLQDGNVLLLQDMGFTKTQAKLYLTLIKLEEADVKTLCKNVNIPRPAVYRVLGELQKNGLVEKKICKPFKYSATPIQIGLQLIMMRNLHEFKELQKKTKKLLRNIQYFDGKRPQEQKYEIGFVEGKDRIIQRIKNEYDNVKKSVDNLTTLQRFLQITDCCLESIAKALDRNIRHRIVIEKTSEIVFPENVYALLAKPNFEMRISSDRLRTNAIIFDQNIVTFNFYPSKSLKESPIIMTNHPSLISMCQDHFDKVWESSTEYQLD